jgi:hypothetical protein
LFPVFHVVFLAGACHLSSRATSLRCSTELLYPPPPHLRVHCSMRRPFLRPFVRPSLPHTCVLSVCRPRSWLFTTE